MCQQKKTVTQVDADSSDDDFLGTVTVDTAQINDWDIELEVNGVPVLFKIDSGADITLVSDSDFQRIDRNGDINLQHSDKRLIGANNLPLPVVGVFDATLVNKDRGSTKQKIYVTRNLSKPLLGKPSIAALQLLTRTNEVSDTPLNQSEYKAKIKAKFPKLFTGLGTIKGAEYKIQLQENARPFSVGAPRRISQPLLPKVKAELDSMLSRGVIRRLDTNEVS